MNKRQIALWASYDFAITILELNVAIYLSEWLVIDQGVSELLYSSVLALSIILALLILPVLGLISDRYQKRLPYLYFFSYTAAIAVVLLGYFGLAIDHKPTLIALSLFLFIIMNISYQGCLLFYNALLSRISDQKSLGLISGLGVSAGYLGAIIGGLVVAAFVNGYIPIFRIDIPILGQSPRVYAFIPTAILFIAAAVPSLLFLSEERTKEKLKDKLNRLKTQIKETPSYYQAVISDIKSFKKYPDALRFLLSFFFFNNAVGTIIIFGPLYMERVFHIDDFKKLLIIFTSLVMAAIGGTFAGWYADKAGHKKTLQRILIIWMILFGAMAWSNTIWLFWIINAIGGFFFGAIWSVSRAFFVTLIPENEQGKFFSFYSIFERFAVIIGPLLWSGIVTVFSGWGSTRYQLALASMAILVAIGLHFLQKPKPRRQSE